MNIASRSIDARQPPYVIAEIGVNHDGSVDRAIQLVEAAKRAGADAIKLQLFETDRLLSRAAKLAVYQSESGAGDPFEMLRELELSIAQMAPIVDAARAAELHAIVTVFSVELVDRAQQLHWDAYKVASPDIINQPLINALCATGLPLLLSTGAATMDEIAEAVSWLGDYPHLLLHCVSAYPAPHQHASLAAIAIMQSAFNETIGYSDHTKEVDTGALAVACGARILEKHITYDRSASGPDHAASLDPEQFAEYVHLAHRAFEMLGEPAKRVLSIEQDVRCVSRQSVTSTREIAAGHRLQSDDLTIKRPGTGIAPSRIASLVGRAAPRAIAADMPITEDDLA